MSKYSPHVWVKNVKPILTHDGEHVILFKAVRQDYYSKQSFTYKRSTETKMTQPYTVGKRITAPDWRNDHTGCGHGLHLCQTPELAASHGTHDCKILAVEVRISDIVPIHGEMASKVKVKSLRVLKEIQWERPEPDYLHNYVPRADNWNPKVGDRFQEARSYNEYTVTHISTTGYGRGGTVVMVRKDGGRTTRIQRKTLMSNYRGMHADVKPEPKPKSKFPTYQSQVEELR